MQRVLWLFILGIGIVLGSCSKTSASSLDDLFAKEEGRYHLLHFQKGNFTNSGKDEYLVFYEDPKQRHDPKALPDIDAVEVFIVDNMRVSKKYLLPNVWSAGYDERTTDIISGFQLDGAGWNGYCFAKDFNRDGYDEILFLTLGGYIFTASVFEFLNGSFVPILAYPATSSLSKLVFDEKDAAFVIYDSGGKKVAEGKRNWFRMKWSADQHRYTSQGSGIVDWYDPKTGKVLK